MKNYIVSLLLLINFNLYAISITQKVSELESSSKFSGRIGFYAINTGNNKVIGYKENERFPFCSTSKLIVVALLLKKSESKPQYLTKIIKYDEDYMRKSGYAPITKNYLNKGMSLLNLAKAAIEYSDNAAMNLIISEVGGINEINKFARLLNDKEFHLDRIEPELNTAIPNDVRDTTTPKAMANTLKELILGNVLNQNSKDLLLDMLKNNTTGAKKVRSVVSKDYLVGDKTGGGDYGTNNDIAIIYPFNAKPIILSIYTTQLDQMAQKNDKVIAEISRLVLKSLLNDKLINK